MAVGLTTVLLIAAIIYTSPSGDSMIESQPPELATAADNSLIVFPMGGGYDDSYWLKIRSDYTVVEASINLVGLDMLNDTQLELFNLVSSDTNDGVSTEPEVITDIFFNKFVVWVDTGSIGGAKSGSDVFVQKWDSASGSWNPPVQLSQDSPNTDAANPSIATDSSGNVYVVYSERGNALSQGGPDSEIFFCKWNGAAWSSPVLLSDDTIDSESANPKISVDSMNNVYVVWVDNGNILSSGTDNDIILRWFDGFTSNWGSPIVVSNDANDGNSIEPSITSFQDSTYITWSDDGNIASSGADYDIVLTSYRNLNLDMMPIIASTDLNDGASRNPSVAANDTRIYLTWQDNGNIQTSGTDNDIFLTHLDLSNYLFAPYILISDNNFGSSVNPEIVLDNTHNLYTCWVDDGNVLGSGTDWDVYYRILSKLSLHDPVLLTNYASAGASSDISICKDFGNQIQFVWEDTADIFTSGTDEDVFIKDIMFEFRYPTYPKLDIGIDGTWDWNYTDNGGNFMDNVEFGGQWLGLLLTSIVESQNDGSGYVQIPFRFQSDTIGAINITRTELRGTKTPEAPENLRILNEGNMHVVDHQPVFSWDFVDSDSASQGRFEAEVGTVSNGNDMWNPTPAVSSETTIKYLGSELQDGQTYYFRVRTADSDGSSWSNWSEPYKFRMNTAPTVISLTPLAGTFDHNITLFWAGQDAENDPLTYYINAFYDNSWHIIVDGTTETNYIWDTTAVAEQSIDFSIIASDGSEDSEEYNPTGIIYIAHNTPPILFIQSPKMDVKLFEKSYIIEWSTEDPDEEDILTISLYYDDDKDPVEKTPIVEDYNNEGEYEWDISTVDPGEYYIAGEVYDGTDESPITYSNGSIIVSFETEIQPVTVTAVQPLAHSSNIPISIEIKATFNKPIDSTTLDHNTFYLKDTKSRLVDGRREYIETQNELRFYPNLLQFNTTYTAVITNGLRDMDGLGLDGNFNGISGEGAADDFSWSFSTMSIEFDSDPPEVLSTSPEADSKNNDIALIIKINFSEPIDPLTLKSKSLLLIKLEDMQSWDGTTFDELMEMAVPGIISYNLEHFQAIFTTSTKLEYNTTYLVSLTSEITDLSGNEFEGYVFSFKTAAEPKAVINPDDINPDDSDDETVIEVFKWDYFYYVFIILIIILIIIATTLIHRRILMGPISIRDIFIIYDDGRLLYHYRPKDNEKFAMSISKEIDDSAVSSMLTAIQDFVKDSFKVSRSSGLNELRHGTLRILIEHGNHSYVAVVCSGGPTTKIRAEMKNVISDLNVKYGFVLKEWDGNMNSIAGIDKLLVPLVTMEKEVPKK